MSGNREDPAADTVSHRGTFALVAVLLAGAGILVSLLGQHLHRPLLEDRVGPALTLLGAAVWVGFHLARRRR